MKFSERLGYQSVRTELQIESMDDKLKNSLWSVYLDCFIDKLSNSDYMGYDLGKFVRQLWLRFFILPIDNAPIEVGGYVHAENLIQRLRQFILEYKNWYDPYDLIQFSVPFAGYDFIKNVNTVLEREKSAYRFVNNELVQITSSVELDEIQEAIDKTFSLESVNKHLQDALKIIANRETHDYRNSVKESICAVESICRIYTKNRKSTLGNALTKLEKDGFIHPSLKSAFSSLYGYTSDSGGIRHALTENDRKVDFHEAKFMLVTCSAFINYIIGRMA